MNKFTAVILDTETTGRKASTVIEAAHLVLAPDFRNAVSIEGDACERFNPGVPIEFGAMATHHILDEELIGCRPSSAYIPPDAEYYIGHNVDFDWEVVGSPVGVKRICTLALARWLWPKPMVDSHTQSALYYWLAKNRITARDTLRHAHSALADVYICHRILRAILDELDKGDEAPASWEALYLLSERARVPTVMSFGKHKDKPIHQLPPSYITWMLKQEDVDPYLVKALHAALNRGGAIGINGKPR